MGLERLCRDQRPGHRCWAFGYDVAIISAETNFLDLFVRAQASPVSQPRELGF